MSVRRAGVLPLHDVVVHPGLLLLEIVLLLRGELRVVVLLVELAQVHVLGFSFLLLLLLLMLLLLLLLLL